MTMNSKEVEALGASTQSLATTSIFKDQTNTTNSEHVQTQTLIHGKNLKENKSIKNTGTIVRHEGRAAAVFVPQPLLACCMNQKLTTENPLTPQVHNSCLSPAFG